MSLLSRSKTKGLIWLAIAVVAVCTIYFYWEYRKYHPSTDNAYVGANIVQVAPQVTGPIQKIYIHNFDYVTKGQRLFDIDPATFIVALNRAKSQLDVTKQNVSSLKREVSEAEASIDQKQSELKLAQQTNARVQELVQRKQLAAADGDRATRDVKVTQGALAEANQKLQEVIARLGRSDEDNAEIRSAKAELARTQLNLNYTQIASPTNGYIVNLTAREGAMVQMGMAQFSIVDSSQWWVDANFKETELEFIRIGQPAEIIVDIYPNHVFHGYVQSISRGSGAAFSIFPAENATGNWVKITQRFPVRVYITDPSSDYPLRIGASSSITINTLKSTHIRDSHTRDKQSGVSQ